jgi:putative endonuclease
MTGKRVERRRAWRFGRLGEAVVAVWLRLQGYRILARDYRTPVGEIDIVARRGGLLVFVEVKARDNAAAGEASAQALTRRQRRRIERAAEAFLKQRPDLAGSSLRFDLVLVGRAGWPLHLRNAWRVGD